MSNLTISQVKITDNLSERAKTCNVTLAPSERVGAPVGEFEFSGDTQQLSGTTMRPNGSQLEVKSGYGTVPVHTIFNGSIENMDDLEDPNQYIYNILLSDVPLNQGYRTKLTIVFDAATYVDPNPTGSTPAWTILETACAQAGIPFGRCDLPNFNVIGTFEAIRKNVLEIAEELCNPFNTFEFQHYFVRVDSVNGLSIIKVDYTLGGEVSNLYSLSYIENKTRSFARYMPDNRIGPAGDILLVGGDKIGSNTETGADGNDGSNLLTKQVTINKTYNSNSSGSSTGGTKWTETTTVMKYVLELTYSASAIAPADGLSLEDYIYQLGSGTLKGINILESSTQSVATRNYEDGELIRLTETYYTYESKSFAQHAYKTSEKTTTVLTYDETTTHEFNYGVDTPSILSKHWYTYSTAGTQESVVTENYVMDRGAWVLESTDVQHDPGTSLENALISYYAAGGATQLSTFPNTASKNSTVEANSQQHAVIGKYKLLNGAVVPTIAPLVSSKDKTSDPNQTQFEQEQRERRAFTISVPFMDYNGLRLLYALCLRQRALEIVNPYWENVKVACSIDTSPAAGESIIASGSGGICEQVEHLITEDSATTSLALKRLVPKIEE